MTTKPVKIIKAPPVVVPEDEVVLTMPRGAAEALVALLRGGIAAGGNNAMDDPEYGLNVRLIKQVLNPLKEAGVESNNLYLDKSGFNILVARHR